MLPVTYTRGTSGQAMPRVRIREIAQAQGLDVAKLSWRSDLAYRTVWSLWNDPERAVPIQTLGKLAETLGVPLTDLIENAPIAQQPAARQ